MIRETIKEAMTLRKLKAIQLAEHIGIAKSTMSLFLSGKINLGQEKLEACLKFLGIVLVIQE